MKCCLIACVAFALPIISAAISLPFLRYFDYAAYDRNPAARVRRSATITIPLRYRSKKFTLLLKPDDSGTFAPDVKLDVDGVEEDSIGNHLFEGRVAGDPESYAHGSLFDGVFDGWFHTGSGQQFYVERTSKYAQGTAHGPLPHSIVYSADDVDDSFFHGGQHHHNDASASNRKSHPKRFFKSTGSTGVHKSRLRRKISPSRRKRHSRLHGSAIVDRFASRSKHSLFRRYRRNLSSSQEAGAGGATASTCGLSGRVKASMEHLQHSGMDLRETTGGCANSTPAYKLPQVFPFAHKSSAFLESSADLLQMTQHRYKRQTDQDVQDIDSRGLYRVRSCSLYIQADQVLYEHIYNNEGQKDKKRTTEEIYALINNHIRAVKKIYEETPFNGITGITFRVQRVTIFTPDTCSGDPDVEVDSTAKNFNPFCKKSVDVSYYLNLNSKKDHSDFCLAYALTYRDFVGGTLGLAWVASPVPGTSGGICEVFKYYNEGSGRVKRSLNTGIMTLVNYNNRVPPKVSQLTLAHEIGHNFGAPHDYPARCQPGLPKGNFIMFASATSGDKPNNAKFSPCSNSNISAVLDAILRLPPTKSIPVGGGKRNCFMPRDDAFCGNQLVEDGEQCDCGFDSLECAERETTTVANICCQPRQDDGSVEGGAKSSGACRLRRGKSCSPTQGTCCESSCSFASTSVECAAESECSYAQTCSGRSPTCPKPRSKADLLPCFNKTAICRSGECKGSICEAIGWEECFITGSDPKEKCKLACKNPKEPESKCLSSFDIAQLATYYQPGINGIYLRPGHPCDNYQGYCDVFQKCRSVDSNGPLSRLKNLLFNKETFENIGKWAKSYWWAVVLMGVALIVVMALFIKCCAVHTPSSNPNRPPAQSIYDTIRRPTTLLRNMHGGANGHRSRSGGGGGGEHRHRHHHHHRQPTGGGAGGGGGARRRSADNAHGEHRRRSGAAQPPPGGGGGHHGGNNPRSVSHPGGGLSGGAVLANGLPPVEPPPPYSAVVSPVPSSSAHSSGPTPPQPSSYNANPSAPPDLMPPAGAPPRGHRKNKKPPKHNHKSNIEMAGR